MVKLQYRYRGAQITPYRPQGRKGPGKAATVIIVFLLVTGLLYGAWKLYDSMSSKEEQNGNTSPALPKPDHPVRKENSTEAPKAAVAVTVSTTELPKEMVVFDRELSLLINRNKLEEARAELQNYFEKNNPAHSYYQHAMKKLAFCSKKLLNSGAVSSYTPYIVVSGDTLGKIAKEQKVTVRSIITESNLEKPDRLKIGQQLRIPAKWSCIIFRNKKSLFVYQAEKLLWVFSLSNIPQENQKFRFNPNNRTFWKSCGLSDKDWTTLKSIIPENSNTQVSCN